VRAPDSSVLVAGYLRGHRFHAATAAALAQIARSGCLIAHTIAETYAVLTATGGPFDVPGETVIAYIEQFMHAEPVWLSGPRYAPALAELAAAGIHGGAIYDGLIAVAARDAGATLVSLDRRAAPVYALLGAPYELLA